MNSYEITFLVQETKQTENIKKAITSLKGKIQEEKHWGKQALTYPINKITSADYFTWQFSMAQKNLPQLKKLLDFDEQIVRYLLLKKDIS